MKSFYRAAKRGPRQWRVYVRVRVSVCVSDASAFEGVLLLLLYAIQTMRKMCNTYVSSSFHPHATPDKQTTSIQMRGLAYPVRHCCDKACGFRVHL